MALVFLSSVILLVWVQTSAAIHFTNTNWNIQQNESFEIQWAYDHGDPTDSSWRVVVFLGGLQIGRALTDGEAFYNGSASDTSTLSATFQSTCDTVQQSELTFGICFEQWGYEYLSWSVSPSWYVQNEKICFPAPRMPTSTKVAIGVCMSLLAIVLIIIGYFYLRSRKLKRAVGHVKPVATAPPSEDIELHDRVPDEVVPSYGENSPPPYTPPK